MRSITVAKNDANQRLDRFISKLCPSLPASLCSKYIRIKRIKLNGSRASAETRLNVGDIVELYINDEFFITAKDEMAYLAAKPQINTIYEDSNIIVINKEAGLSVHEDDTGNPDTLVNRVKAYCLKKGEWNPDDENSFSPSLCNRIDRNTAGLVIAAKNADALREMNELIRLRRIDKYYLCLAHGSFKRKEGSLKGYLVKRESDNFVEVYDRPVPGAKSAITEYKVIDEKNGFSLIECKLITGRTHQIRAQLANAGHPLYGDGKYGKTEKTGVGRKYQALFSYKAVFPEDCGDGCLSYLGGRVFECRDIDFVRDFYADLIIPFGK